MRASKARAHHLQVCKTSALSNCGLTPSLAGGHQNSPPPESIMLLAAAMYLCFPSVQPHVAPGAAVRRGDIQVHCSSAPLAHVCSVRTRPICKHTNSTAILRTHWHCATSSNMAAQVPAPPQAVLQ